jgi:transcriptional regulator with XRE-family HTH domain
MPKSAAEICIELKVTVEQLAERTGIERGRLEAILLSRWTPSPDDRRRIAEQLGVALDDIAWGHATPIQHLYGHGPG